MGIEDWELNPILNPHLQQIGVSILLYVARSIYINIYIKLLYLI